MTSEEFLNSLRYDESRILENNIERHGIIFDIETLENLNRVYAYYCFLCSSLGSLYLNHCDIKDFRNFKMYGNDLFETLKENDIKRI